MRNSLQIVLLAFFFQCAFSAPVQIQKNATQALTLAIEEYFKATEMLKYELNSISEHRRKFVGVEELKTKAEPTNDIALTIGGFYQSGDCGTDSVPNQFTGGLSCPAGFTASPIGRIKTPEGQMCGGTIFVCYRF